jgi:hypothetical protein
MKNKHRGRPADIEKPKPRLFSAPPCGFCKGLRPEHSNYSRVYATLKKAGLMIRYIRCHFCQQSWVHSEPLSSGIENQPQTKAETEVQLETPTPPADKVKP